MKRVSLFLAVVLGVLGLQTAASAQPSPFFSRPAVSLRVGTVQAIDDDTGGPAPYVEVQSRANLGETPFGLALYGGLSYEQLAPRTIVCFTRPCPRSFQGRRTYLDLAMGFRIGVFPRQGPVNAFIGFAPHLRGRTTESPRADGERWFQYSTVEAGANVQVPITSRFGISAGVRGDFSLLSDDEGLLELGRYGVHLGVQYEL